MNQRILGEIQDLQLLQGGDISGAYQTLISGAPMYQKYTHPCQISWCASWTPIQGCQRVFVDRTKLFWPFQFFFGPLDQVAMMSNPWNTQDAVVSDLHSNYHKQGFMVSVMNQKVDGMVRSLYVSVKTSNITPSVVCLFQEASPGGTSVTQGLVG